MKTKEWHVANTGTYQGLIVDSRDGRSVAVSYDKEDARLLAAAPKLLSALKALMADAHYSNGAWKIGPLSHHPDGAIALADAVIMEAEEEEQE